MNFADLPKFRSLYNSEIPKFSMHKFAHLPKFTYDKYMEIGGFPEIISGEEIADEYVDTLVSNILERDIVPPRMLLSGSWPRHLCLRPRESQGREIVFS